jgi:site-specific recombinase XerC
MERMRPPKIEERPILVISNEHCAPLLSACAGTDFEVRRDTAIVRVLLDTGARLAEMASISMDDVDVKGREIYVIGKGAKAAPFR